MGFNSVFKGLKQDKKKSALHEDLSTLFYDILLNCFQTKVVEKIKHFFSIQDPPPPP
jgi:hypothetical protein